MMPGPSVVRYRPPRARVAVAYSTKDRVALTRLTIAPLIDDPALDLYWFDGSSTEAGQQLPLELCAGRGAICEVHQNVVGGPDRAIMYALETLRVHSYDLVILVENDVLLSEGWFAAMCASIDRAQTAGFTVGAATVRVFDRRVLSFNDEYCLMLNSGAGFIAMRPAAIDIILAHYRTLDGEEFIRHIKTLTDHDISATVEFVPSQRLSVDFIFDLMLYLHGYVVAAPPVTYARMIDDVAVTCKLVTTPDQHLPQTRCLITKPDQIRTIHDPFYRFQKSPLSDRLLVGCHQLQIGVNLAEVSRPVLLEGQWRRRWLQGLGPFALHGAGTMSFLLHDTTIGLLLLSGETDSLLRQLRPDGSIMAEASLGPNAMMDIAFAPASPEASEIILQIASGEVCIVGLTMEAAAVARYANDRPTVDHLPF